MKNFKDTQPSKLTVISLFSGCGAIDLGFKRQGLSIVWAIDNDLDCVETYKKNIGNHIINKSICDVPSREIPDADIIVGGFPCQGFSIANMKRSIHDDRNILYEYLVKVIQIKKPKIFIAENVKGILSLDKGKVFKNILEDFHKSGYKCKYAILNAADYGVPQNRERVIILGQREDITIQIEFPPQSSHFKSYVSVGQALLNFPDPDNKHNLKNHIYSKFKLKFNGYISNRRINPDLPCPTITARGDHKGGAMVMHHPSNQRRLTCREMAYIQGFPIDFEFIGSMTSVYRQIANALPYPVAEAVASSVYKALTNNCLNS